MKRIKNNDFSDVKLQKPYVPKKAEEMSDYELCRNIAFVNMIKWLNVGETLSGVSLDEDMIFHRKMTDYIDTESGDLLQYMKLYNGFPFKYSIDPRHLESREMGELKIVI